MEWLKNYPQLYYRAKAVVVAVGVIVTLVKLAVVDHAISFDEAEGVWAAVLGVLTVLGVHQVENGPAPSSRRGFHVPDVENQGPAV